MSKCQKNVQNCQLSIICQMSKSQTAGLLKISITNDSLYWVGRCMGGKVSTDHKSSKTPELSQLGQGLFYF